MFGQVVVDNERMHAIVAEKLAHCATAIGGQVLERRRLRSRGRNHDRIFKRAVFLEHFDDLCHGRPLLPNRHIDAIELFGLVVSGVDFLLIDDRIDRQRRLAGLPVADDQFALPASDRNQAVDCLQPGLHGLVHRFAGDDTRRL